MSRFKVLKPILHLEIGDSSCDVSISAQIVMEVESGSEVSTSKGSIRLYRNTVKGEPIHVAKANDEGFVTYKLRVRRGKNPTNLTIIACGVSDSGATSSDSATITIPAIPARERNVRPSQPGRKPHPPSTPTPKYEPTFKVTLQTIDLDRYVPVLVVTLLSDGKPVEGKEVNYFDEKGRRISLEESQLTDTEGETGIELNAEDYPVAEFARRVGFSVRIKIDNQTTLTLRDYVTIPGRSSYKLDFPKPQVQEIDKNVYRLTLKATVLVAKPTVSPDGTVSKIDDDPATGETIEFLDGTVVIEKGKSDGKGEVIREWTFEQKEKLPKNLYISATSTRGGKGAPKSSGTHIIPIPGLKDPKPETERREDMPRGHQWRTIGYDLQVPNDLKAKEVAPGMFLIPARATLLPIEEDQNGNRKEKPIPVRNQEISWFQTGVTKSIGTSRTTFRGYTEFDFGPYESQDYERPIRILANTTINGKVYTSDVVTVWIPARKAEPTSPPAPPVPEKEVLLTGGTPVERAGWLSIEDIKTICEGQPAEAKIYLQSVQGAMLSARIAGAENWQVGQRLEFTSPGELSLEVRLATLPKDRGGDDVVLGLVSKGKGSEVGPFYISGVSYLVHGGPGGDSLNTAH